MQRHLHGLSLLAIALAALGVRAADRAPSPQAMQFFEAKIRPVLADNCFKCHGAMKHRGGLRVDSLASLLTGGDQGRALVPGKPDNSLMIQAIRQQGDLKMPPMKKLSAQQIADLTQWVQMGAPWPGADRSSVKVAANRTVAITAQDKAYWAFRPINRPPVPLLHVRTLPSQPIDCFVRVKLESKDLEPNPRADRRTLIRRAYFDLIGLPPTPEQVAAFVNDPDPQAYAHLIDDLLARPQYGERWARHWLDVVRYAQTNGYERDGEKPLAWKFRDYVIRAFNEDKPYDRFVMEQLAGDELPDGTDDARIATGFYRLGVYDDEPDDARMAEFDGLDDIMVTTGAAFLGLTIGCARCHDHKFDPIPQADYYSVLAFFGNIRPYKKPDFKAGSATLLAVNDHGHSDWALAVRENGPNPPATHVLIRGNASTPGPEVKPHFLSVLGGVQPKLSAQPKNATTSGRRLALARWIANRDNPLTARAIVNRIWQHHFGQGIVKTTTDLGHAGVPPTHPKLLDWLAADFMDNGWSIKRLHRTIMLSETYQRSSSTANAKATAVDPGNEWLWRQNLRRLEAEALRDTILAVSGRLNPAMGGRGFFPHLGAEVLAGGSKPGADWDVSPVTECDRRSVYAFIKRSMVPPVLDVFDYSNTAQPLGERPTTTVAPQALLLSNSDFMQRQAEGFAERLEREAGTDPSAQIKRAFQLAFDRSPSARELVRTCDYLSRQTHAFDALRSRIAFRPEVPISLHESYLGKLKPDDFLSGPRDHWQYYRGRWTGGYEGIRSVDRQRTPFTLWQGASFADGTITGELELARAVEFAGLIVRGTAEADQWSGYEFVFRPRRQIVSLFRRGPEPVLIAEEKCKIVSGTPLAFRIELAGPRIRLWLGRGDAVLDVTDPQPVRDAGHFGIRPWGAAVSLDHVKIRTSKGFYDVAPESGPGFSRHRALASLCLLMLNLNELMYVD